MDLLAKVIGKEIKTEKGSFISYKLLTSAGNWYRTAGIAVEELAKFDGEVVLAEISRKFVKHITTLDGEDRYLDTLVIEKLTKPNEEQYNKFVSELAKFNEASLKDVK